MVLHSISKGVWLQPSCYQFYASRQRNLNWRFIPSYSILIDQVKFSQKFCACADIFLQPLFKVCVVVGRLKGGGEMLSRSTLSLSLSVFCILLHSSDTPYSHVYMCGLPNYLRTHCGKTFKHILDLGYNLTVRSIRFLFNILTTATNYIQKTFFAFFSIFDPILLPIIQYSL